ncbi:MAG: ABC transporter permease [Gemmatimonadales bacterium]
MAWRDSRRSRRRLALYLSAVSLGVAALVAINSFSTNVAAAVRAQARELLGADLELRSRRPFPDSIEAVLDSMRPAVARVTSFASMVLAPRTGLTRLVEVRAIDGDFPFYGTIRTDPRDLWPSFRSGRQVLVDPAILVYLNARVGDTVHIGDARFAIAGAITDAPGDVGLRTAIGPRVYLPAQYLAATNLLRFGSRAQYRAYLRIPDNAALQGFLNRHNALFEQHRIRTETAAEEEEDVSRSLGRLARYLGLVGLVALLLGGLGVGSAVTVFVRAKLDGAALLRCLGAPARTVLSIYVIQAVALGTLGAAAGVALGLVAQMVLPTVVADFIPVRVSVAIDWPTVWAGFAIGTGTAAAFALLPLLRLKDVPPLRALRREFDDRRLDGRTAGRPVGAVILVTGLLCGLVLVSIWQAPSTGVGLAFAAAVLVTAGLLWAAARLLMAVSRRLFPKRASYVIRQGVANLFRPENQTVPVTLAIGFGVFLVATLYVVQRNLLDQFALDASADRPNLVLFDIQVDQRDGVGEILRRHGAAGGGETPIVPARIARVKGQPAESLPSGWAVRREYRNTYRDTLVESEELLQGAWWTGPGARGLGDAPEAPAPRPRISIEEEVAAELGVGLGDRITWNVQGVEIETQIASVRRVAWARFQPNFFVVFEPGVLERAPQTFVTLTRIDDPTRRAELQRDVVLAYPNISALDLTLVQRALDGLLRSVSLAVRFMALFSIGAGLVILVGALAASRFQRLREAVLLKTMGATGGQVRRIMLTEYVAWGSLAALVGVLLAGAAGWALITQLFESTYRLPLLELGGVWLVVCALTAVVGLANSGEALRGTPLGVLREISE